MDEEKATVDSLSREYKESNKKCFKDALFFLKRREVLIWKKFMLYLEMSFCILVNLIVLTWILIALLHMDIWSAIFVAILFIFTWGLMLACWGESLYFRYIEWQAEWHISEKWMAWLDIVFQEIRISDTYLSFPDPPNSSD